uniref:Uncharacterized protein n=1 Tax=Cacopsylla melanoneura TaxID=428564 RepID=A0A8D9E6R9_9HEMI
MHVSSRDFSPKFLVVSSSLDEIIFSSTVAIILTLGVILWTTSTTIYPLTSCERITCLVLRPQQYILHHFLIHGGNHPYIGQLTMHHINHSLSPSEVTTKFNTTESLIADCNDLLVKETSTEDAVSRQPSVVAHGQCTLCTNLFHAVEKRYARVIAGPQGTVTPFLRKEGNRNKYALLASVRFYRWI